MGGADVVIVDYGMGNVGSIRNMLSKIGVTADTSAVAEVVLAADRVVLPGVGAFDEAMATLVSLDLVEPLVERARRGRPLLGVCLGMQLLLDGSDEGSLPGLGLVPGRCRRLDRADPTGAPLRVPHMGWNEVLVEGSDDRLPSLGSGRFYFVHSFHAVPEDPTHVIGTTEYGRRFASAIGTGSTTGVQFHPEKSHRHGLRLLADYVAA